MMERDALDITVAVFTITTGVVLAAAGSLAYIVQRARYRREVEPDLDIAHTWVDNEGVVCRPRELSFTLVVRVHNDSALRAHDLHVTADVSPSVTTREPGVWLLSKGSRDRLAGSRGRELGPGREIELHTTVVWEAPEAATEAQIARAIAGLQLHGRVFVSYRGAADVAHLIMTPLRGRFRHERQRPMMMQPLKHTTATATAPSDADDPDDHLTQVLFRAELVGPTEAGPESYPFPIRLAGRVIRSIPRMRPRRLPGGRHRNGA